MDAKQVIAILERLDGKGGALTPPQIEQARAIAAEVLGEHDSESDLNERFQLFLALLSFAIK